MHQVHRGPAAAALASLHQEENAICTKTTAKERLVLKAEGIGDDALPCQVSPCRITKAELKIIYTATDERSRM